jgi:outer membrane usher protein
MRIWILLVFFAMPAMAAAPFPGNRPALVAPMMLDSETLGEVWVYPDSRDEKFELESEGLLKALKQGLVPDLADRVSAHLSQRPKVTLAAVRAEGISLRFDETSLLLRLEPSDDQRAKKSIRVRRGNDREERETLGPAPLSGYLNATVSQGFVYPQLASRQPFRSNLSLVNNMRGVVLETGATFQEKDPAPWRRDDTRLTRDFENALMRVSAGDVPIQGTGYQGSRPLGGVSLTRQYSIQPYLNTRPLSRTEIQILRPSTIEVYVNNGFVNRLNAQAGPLQLSDFPLFSGVNKVDLKITDDAGRIEWVNLNLLYDVQLLGQGIQEFAYQLGAPSSVAGSDRRYDRGNFTFSGYHRMGITDTLTLGASFQSDQSLWLAGSEFGYLTRVGLFTGEAGLSQRYFGPASMAGRLRFKSLDYKLGSDKPWRGTLEAEYKARLFAAIGQTDFQNPFSWRYELTISRPLTAMTTVSLSGGYLQNRLGLADQKSARLDLVTELEPRLRLAANYGITKESSFGQAFQVVLTWVDPGGRFYGNLSYDYPTKTIRAEATKNSANVVDDFRATAGVQRSPAATQADGFVDYTHEKANLRFEHATTRNEANASVSANTLNRSTFTAATAVAWAGGVFAWTRPIADSFAILQARPVFRRFDLPINRVENHPEGRINRFGPGVIPTITAYNPTPLTVDSSGLPMGYSLGREYFLARPTYRSGVLIEVGGESTVLLTGHLLGPDGKPLSVVTGTVAPLSKDSRQREEEFFTNQEGLFLLENLVAGIYEIRVDGYKPVKLTVPAGAVGFQRFPPYQLKRDE